MLLCLSVVINILLFFIVIYLVKSMLSYMIGFFLMGLAIKEAIGKYG